MLKAGQIRPSTSQFGSSILFTKKADGSLRMCVDYRQLNKNTIRNRAPLPNLEELRDRMKGSTVFSKMDLNEGFYNIQVAEKDRYKTAFRCRYGHFEFNVMPMGLANAPAVFQAMMNRIFRELIDISVICYMDDILVYSATLIDHERDLEAVFQLIRKHQLKLKATKCQLYKREIDFCGHTLNSEGIKISSSKVEAMQFTPEFRSVKDVRAYIGTLVWFHNFIPDYAAFTQPLTKLLVKDTPFVWGQ
jgi:hypothetical protein